MNHVKFSDVLDCVGRDFPREWGKLFLALSDRQARRHGRDTAAATVSKWRNRSAVAWRLLPAVLLGEANQRELLGFCVHGYCAAVHRLSTHRLQGVAGGGAGGGGALRQEAATCASFGGAWWTWRLLGESRWSGLVHDLDVLTLAGKLDRRLSRQGPGSLPVLQQTPKDAGEAAGLLCPDSGLHAHARCWYLSRESESCASACTARRLRFAWAVAGEGDPMIPLLIRRHPANRQLPRGRLECYVPTEDTFYTAEAKLNPTSADGSSPEDLTSEECQLACPCAVPDLDPARRTSTDRYLYDYRAQLEAALAATLPPVPGGGDHSRTDNGVTFAGFGVHFTTLLEPISAMRRVLPESLRIAAVFYGSSHPPPQMLIQEVCPTDQEPTRGAFHCFLSTSPGDSFWHGIVDRPSLRDALGELAAAVASDRFIQRADCLVCGGGHSPALCLMLRMVTGAPLFFNLQAPLTFRMSKNPDQRAMLVAYFREMARPTLATASRGRTVVSTSLIFFQRQYWVQTGCLLPVVRNHNLYAAVSIGAGVTEGKPKLKEVLFWQNHIALKPDGCMAVWRFVKQHVLDNYPWNLVFKNVRKMPTFRPWRRVYALGDQESTMLSYGAIARRFAAAVLFPHDLGMISFDDLYAIGVPVFMPENELIVSMAFAHLSSTSNYPWYLLREEHADLHAARADADAPLPWDPGWGGRQAVNRTGRGVYLGRGVRDTGKLLSAVAVSNFALFPHIRRFSSLSGLLRDLSKLSAEDLAQTAAAMHLSAEAAWEVTAEFYRRAAWHLLSIPTASA